MRQVNLLVSHSGYGMQAADLTDELNRQIHKENAARYGRVYHGRRFPAYAVATAALGTCPLYLSAPWHYVPVFGAGVCFGLVVYHLAAFCFTPSTDGGAHLWRLHVRLLWIAIVGATALYAAREVGLSVHPLFVVVELLIALWSLVAFVLSKGALHAR